MPPKLRYFKRVLQPRIQGLACIAYTARTAHIPASRCRCVKMTCCSCATASSAMRLCSRSASGLHYLGQNSYPRCFFEQHPSVITRQLHDRRAAPPRQPRSRTAAVRERSFMFVCEILPSWQGCSRTDSVRERSRTCLFMEKLYKLPTLFIYVVPRSYCSSRFSSKGR